MKVQLKIYPKQFPAPVLNAAKKANNRYVVIVEPFEQQVEYSEKEFNILYNIVQS